MKHVKTTLAALALLALGALALPGCNTAEGLGKDAEVIGERIQDEAREHKNY